MYGLNKAGARRMGRQHRTVWNKGLFAKTKPGHAG